MSWINITQRTGIRCQSCQKEIEITSGLFSSMAVSSLLTHKSGMVQSARCQTCSGTGRSEIQFAQGGV